MFIKNIKNFFKQWQCGKCRRCFKQVGRLDDHVKTCNVAGVKHIWPGGVNDPPKKYYTKSSCFWNQRIKT